SKTQAGSSIKSTSLPSWLRRYSTFWASSRLSPSCQLCILKAPTPLFLISPKNSAMSSLVERLPCRSPLWQETYVGMSVLYPPNNSLREDSYALPARSHNALSIKESPYECLGRACLLATR